MNADVQAQLRNDLRILATAAAAHNVPAAQAALAALNADTAAAHAAGKLSASKLAQIRAPSGRGSRGSDHRDAESYAHHHPDTHAHPHA
jgi:acetylglutamate kinase